MSEEKVALTVPQEEQALAPRQSRVKAFFIKFLGRKTAVVAACFIILLVIIAFLAPVLQPFDPATPDYDAILSPPNAKHLFGTDEYGRDILSRLLAGSRLSLSVSLSSVTLGAGLGAVLGILAGYYGGWLDSLIMRTADVLLAFPDILLAIAIVAVIGPGLSNVIIAVAVFSIPSFARIMRSSTLTVKQSLYVEAARSIGATNRSIMWKHIFPGTVASIIVNFTMRIGTAILAAASLSFLGFGAKPTEPDWGAMLSTGRNYLGVAPHIVYFSGGIIFLTVLAFNLLGDGLRDTLDPKIQ